MFYIMYISFILGVFQDNGHILKQTI